MALNPANIHVGPARIFLGVTLPASGDPPTPMGHTNGVPASGVEVGYTQGDAVYRKVNETGEIPAEQTLSPVLSFLTGERVEIEFLALENVYETLRAAFDNTGTVNDVNRMMFYGGGLAYSLRYQSVMLSSARTSQAGKYEITVLYNAYSVNGFEGAYRKNDAKSMRIILRGQPLGSRTLGDQVYQHFIEK
jgi:hypothetical protein